MATVQEIRKRDQHTKIAHFMGASPEECDLIKTQQERRYLLTVVDQLAVALREISKRLPCDTPCENREPRGQCEVCKATDYGHWCAGCLARKALALVDPTPEPTKGEDDGE
jgi:hypothetical protein